jgi:hypothetical protein
MSPRWHNAGSANVNQTSVDSNEEHVFHAPWCPVTVALFSIDLPAATLRTYCHHHHRSFLRQTTKNMNMAGTYKPARPRQEVKNAYQITHSNWYCRHSTKISFHLVLRSITHAGMPSVRSAQPCGLEPTHRLDFGRGYAYFRTPRPKLCNAKSRSASVEQPPETRPNPTSLGSQTQPIVILLGRKCLISTR